MFMKLLANPLFWKIVGSVICIFIVMHLFNTFLDSRMSSERLEFKSKIEDLDNQVLVKEANIIELKSKILELDTSINEKVKLIKDLQLKRVSKESVQTSVSQEIITDVDLIKKARIILPRIDVNPDSIKFNSECVCSSK